MTTTLSTVHRDIVMIGVKDEERKRVTALSALPIPYSQRKKVMERQEVTQKPSTIGQATGQVDGETDGQAEGQIRRQIVQEILQ